MLVVKEEEAWCPPIVPITALVRVVVVVVVPLVVVEGWFDASSASFLGVRFIMASAESLLLAAVASVATGWGGGGGGGGGWGNGEVGSRITGFVTGGPSGGRL